MARGASASLMLGGRTDARARARGRDDDKGLLPRGKVVEGIYLSITPCLVWISSSSLN